MKGPKSILNYAFTDKVDVSIQSENATEFWLCNDSNGASYHLKWWGNGWVIQIQHSFFCKSKEFKHESDIVAFLHSHYGPTNTWEHVFETKEEAVECFRCRNFPNHQKDNTFYNAVYDILVDLGGAESTNDYRESFIFNYTKDTYGDGEWGFKGLLNAECGAVYQSEINRVYCYKEDETPERIKVIEKINDALKKLEDGTVKEEIVG